MIDIGLDDDFVLRMSGDTVHGFDRIHVDEVARLHTSRVESERWKQLKEEIWKDIAVRS